MASTRRKTPCFSAVTSARRSSSASSAKRPRGTQWCRCADTQRCGGKAQCPEALRLSTHSLRRLCESASAAERKRCRVGRVRRENTPRTLPREAGAAQRWAAAAAWAWPRCRPHDAARSNARSPCAVVGRLRQLAEQRRLEEKRRALYSLTHRNIIAAHSYTCGAARRSRAPRGGSPARRLCHCRALPSALWCGRVRYREIRADRPTV